jgi:hypothetical protein
MELVIFSVCFCLLAITIPIVVRGRETDNWLVFLIRKILPPLLLAVSMGLFLSFLVIAIF